MNIILSHITALEYWRLVGNKGIPIPRPTSTCVVQASTFTSKDRFPQALGTLLASSAISRPVHILTSHRSMHANPPMVYHHEVCVPLPRKSLYTIDGELGIVSPEMCLLQIAKSFHPVEIAGLMHEFCGYYSPSSLSGGLVNREPLTNMERLANAANRFEGMHGIRTFKRASRFVKGPSRSPMETALALLLSLPYSLGGYSFSDLELNSKVEVQHPSIKELEPDILFRNSGLCIEYDGRAFHEGAVAVKRDVARVNVLTLAGYDVITLDASQVMRCDAMHAAAISIAKAMGKRLRIDDYRAFSRKRAYLRRMLLNPQGVVRGGVQSILAIR